MVILQKIQHSEFALRNCKQEFMTQKNIHFTYHIKSKNNPASGALVQAKYYQIWKEILHSASDFSYVACRGSYGIIS